MSTFIESEHPRNKVGEFTEKDLAMAAVATGSTDFLKTEARKVVGLPDDYKGKVTVTPVTPNTTEIRARGDGINMLRYLHDEPGNKFIDNTNFQIDPGDQYHGKSKYKGHGAEIFSRQVTEAAARGYKYIQANADRTDSQTGYKTNGYYTWARLGYEPDPGKSHQQLDQKISDYNTQYGTDVKSLRELMSTSAGQQWWKTNGVSFAGRFDLAPNSTSRTTLDDYMRNRYGRAVDLTKQYADQQKVLEDAAVQFGVNKALPQNDDFWVHLNNERSKKP